MGEFLTLDESVKRDGNGELLAQVVELETIEGDWKIKAIPLTKGELAEIQQKKELGQAKNIDQEIIKEHCLEPKYEDKHFENMTMTMINAIVFAIMSISTGISQEKMKENTFAQAIDYAEEELKKKD